MDTLSEDRKLSKLVLPPSEMGFVLKGKNLLPFTVDTFSEGSLCADKHMGSGSHKSCHPYEKRQKIYQVWAVLLSNKIPHLLHPQEHSSSGGNQQFQYDLQMQPSVLASAMTENNLK